MKKIFLFLLALFFLQGCFTKELTDVDKKEVQADYSNISLEYAENSYWKSEIYRNGFVEYNIATEEEVKNKLQSTYQQLFYGNDGLIKDGGKSLVIKVGDDMAYVNTIDSEDIRSEGMSYGMMISVMMNDQSMFNKLWKFSKNYMQNKSGSKNKYFAWCLNNTSPYSAKDYNSAPDGEEYIVMALMFASNRWGNGSGIFNYEEEANDILYEMINKSNSSTKAVFHKYEKQIVFSPDTSTAEFTDPSYHLPSFTKLWSMWAKNDNELLSEITNISRNFFVNASHPTTGLFSDYSTFEGDPIYVSFNSNSNKAAHDSHRVIQNIAMDYLWFSQDERQIKLAERFLDFAYGQYKTAGQFVGVYEVDGTPLVDYSTNSQIAMNAVGAMITDKGYEKFFIEKLWNQQTPEGMWRYYNGLLHMLGLLHVAGKYKIYK